MTYSIPAVFLPAEDCNSYLCYGNCSAPARRDHQSGRWYITMNHPGFNSPANNRDGYETKAAAVAAIRFYGRIREIAADGTILNGFDYQLQNWVVDGVLIQVGNAREHWGKRVAEVPGHEVRKTAGVLELARKLPTK